MLWRLTREAGRRRPRCHRIPQPAGLEGRLQILGYLLLETGKPAEAEAEYRTAMAIQQKLADNQPAVPDYRKRLEWSHVNLGLRLLDTGKPAAAEAEYRQALAIREKLADDHPAVADNRSRLAGGHDGSPT